MCGKSRSVGGASVRFPGPARCIGCMTSTIMLRRLAILASRQRNDCAPSMTSMEDLVAATIKPVLSGQGPQQPAAGLYVVSEMCTSCGLLGHDARACTTLAGHSSRKHIEQPELDDPGPPNHRAMVDWEVCTRHQCRGGPALTLTKSARMFVHLATGWLRTH